MNDILTVEQVAQLLECEPGTVQNKARDAELPAVKFGRSWVFPRSALLIFLHDLSYKNMRYGKAAATARKNRQRLIDAGVPIQVGRSPANIAHHAAKRRAAKKNRTVPWADLEAIKKLYADAARLSKETGIFHHVDHIIPMQGVFVSGLHVENNMQVIPAIENMSKHNRFDVEVQQ